VRSFTGSLALGNCSETFCTGGFPSEASVGGGGGAGNWTAIWSQFPGRRVVIMALGPAVSGGAIGVSHPKNGDESRSPLRRTETGRRSDQLRD